MLLVSFHGGSGGQNNVFAYDQGQLKTQTALNPKNPGDLSELRALVSANGYLYAANGKKSESNVLCFKRQAGPEDYQFDYVDKFVVASFSKDGEFENSIAHPYSLAFGGGSYCYISNQDTNVVARANVSTDGARGSIGAGSQSAYLTQLCSPNCTYLDGTFAGSQQGDLPNVKVQATDVPSLDGGLGVSIKDGKVQNSVRDVAVWSGTLFVCDEPDSLIRLYSLSGGTYLGQAGPGLTTKPTHLSVQNGGLYVSAGAALLWSALSTSPASLNFKQILSIPGGVQAQSIGGITFDNAGNVYVAYQDGTGSVGSGAIYQYSVQQTNPQTQPVFSNGAPYAAALPDTPEFLLFLQT
ncbi:MAG: hypothetical protein JO340_12955 [Acidobacteriaceae bacterium]|nr:hypothetical protein [Acidobacteriaceae bacterium]